MSSNDVTELRHQFVNDLNIVHALLGMTARSVDDATARRALESTKRRVRTIALAHASALHSTDVVGKVDSAEYFGAIAAETLSALDAGSDVSVSHQIDSVQLPLARAVPFGLALLDLLSSALDARSEWIRFGLGRNDESLELWVECDAAALAESAIVALSAEQLGARVRHSTPDTGGARVAIQIALGEAAR
jgi:Histidine kinase